MRILTYCKHNTSLICDNSVTTQT